MAGQQPPVRSWFRLASIARMEAAEAAAAAAAARATSTPTTPLLPRTPIPRPQEQPTSATPPPPPQQQPPPPPPPQLPLPPPPPPMPPAEPQPELPVTPTPPQPPPSPPTPPPPQLPLPPPPPSMPPAEHQPELPVTPTPQPDIQTQITKEAPPPPPPPNLSSNEPRRLSTPPPTTTVPESPKIIRPFNSSPPHSPTAMKTNNNANPEPEPETKTPPPPQPQTFSVAPEEKTITNSTGNRANNVFYNKLQGPQTKEEKQLRVITMAGENTGAVMDIGSAAPRRLGHRIHHAEGNGLGRKMEQEHTEGKKEGNTATKTKHMEAVVNSNVQGINNSIVLNSSSTQHSPGVHITFASNRKPKGSSNSSGHKENHSDHHLH